MLLPQWSGPTVRASLRARELVGRRVAPPTSADTHIAGIVRSHFWLKVHFDPELNVRLGSSDTRMRLHAVLRDVPSAP